jgi:hypothetical protein
MCLYYTCLLRNFRKQYGQNLVTIQMNTHDKCQKEISLNMCYLDKPRKSNLRLDYRNHFDNLYIHLFQHSALLPIRISYINQTLYWLKYFRLHMASRLIEKSDLNMYQMDTIRMSFY